MMIALGECLAKRKINLIYGGGTSGLMGTIAKTMSDAGCVVTGFLPEFFVKRGKQTRPNSSLKAIVEPYIPPTVALSTKSCIA